MFAASRIELPLAIQVFLADKRVPFQGGSQAQVRLCRERAPRPAGSSWKAIVTLSYSSTQLDPDTILAEAETFLVDDERGPIGVVDEVHPAGAGREGSLVVACGWFGRRCLTLRFDDVDEIRPAEERLIVRPGLSAVAQERQPVGSGFAWLSRAVSAVRRLLDMERRYATSKPAH